MTVTVSPPSGSDARRAGRGRRSSSTSLEAPGHGDRLGVDRSSAASWSASPSTDTTGGSTVIDATSKPAAGVAGDDRVDRQGRGLRFGKTGIVTWAVSRLDVDRADRVAELVDRRRASTSWLTSMPRRLDDDVAARAATTVSTTDCGPGHRRRSPGRPSSSPSVEPVRDGARGRRRPAPSRDVESGRARRVTPLGSKPRTVDPRHRCDVTLDRERRPGRRRIDADRSTVGA